MKDGRQNKIRLSRTFCLLGRLKEFSLVASAIKRKLQIIFPFCLFSLDLSMRISQVTYKVFPAISLGRTEESLAFLTDTTHKVVVALWQNFVVTSQTAAAAKARDVV